MRQHVRSPQRNIRHNQLFFLAFQRWIPQPATPYAAHIIPRVGDITRYTHQKRGHIKGSLMSTIEFDMFQSRQRSDWVRLQTLAKLRWIAILGQAFALIISVQVFDLHIQTGFAAMTVIASIGVNLAFRLIYPENKRLQEREAFFILVFDIVQLSVLAV